MTPKIFSAETPEINVNGDLHWTEAQTIFEAWLKEQPVVISYGSRCMWAKEGSSPSCGCNFKNPTHTARLVAIEEIKREPCKHEPKPVWVGDKDKVFIASEIEITVNGNHWECKHCGVKLVAEWKAAE